MKTPFSRLSCSSQGSHFKQRFSSQDFLLRNFGNFSFYSLYFCPNFSSQAPKFWNFQLTSLQIGKFLVHKPPNLEIFSSQAPFSEANISSQAPHFGNPGRTPLPEKKLSAPRVRVRGWEGSKDGERIVLGLGAWLKVSCWTREPHFQITEPSN